MLLNLSKVFCSYDPHKIVLSIEKLQIFENELVFFIGPSGVGKSTLLETLGLMNNTVKNSSYEIFELNFSKSKDFESIWNNNNLKNDLRKNHFSFIFQDDNLFDSMSVIENAVSAKVIQSNDMKIIYTKALILFGKLLYDLFDDSIDCEISMKICNTELNDSQKVRLINESSIYNLSIFKRLLKRNVSELSGGQKQRLSFIRAIITDYKLLFADEPTGNLDVKKAEEAISNLKNQLVNRSAVVVSHDLSLAIKFADKIIAIRKENNIGVIDSNSIFVRENSNWIHKDKILSNDTAMKTLQKSM